MSRVWFTGAKDGQPHRFRFFFDGEQTPRLAGDIKELFGGQFAPFLAPLAEYNNYCWYSFVPMPYSKNLRIECEQGPPEDSGAPRKVYYQVAESALPRGTPVETFAWPLPERDLAALEKARGVWQTNRLPPAGELRESDLAEGQERIRIAGPGVIRRLEFEPQWDRIPEESRDAILRDWLVAIRYDGSTNDSVKVPLGDLCGLPWRRVRTQSLYFGMTGNALICAFPMPIAETEEIRLEAGKISPVPVKIRAWMAARPEASAGRLGYFHAGWWRTTPNDVGRPHPILRVKGAASLSAACSRWSRWMARTGRWRATKASARTRKIARLAGDGPGGLFQRRLVLSERHGGPDARAAGERALPHGAISAYMPWIHPALTGPWTWHSNGARIMPAGRISRASVGITWISPRPPIPCACNPKTGACPRSPPGCRRGHDGAVEPRTHGRLAGCAR